MSDFDPSKLARGARAVVTRPKEKLGFTCAARAPGGELYLGSTHGVVIFSGGKTHHVKLKGEAFTAGHAGVDGVWFAGADHLVEFDGGRTHKLRRADFGIPPGPAQALLVRGGDLWLGLRAPAGESPLYRIEVAARRVDSHQAVRGLLSGSVRGLASFGGGVCALTETQLVFAIGDAVTSASLVPDPAVQPGPHVRRTEPAQPAMERARRLVDAAFLAPSGSGVVGRDVLGLFSMQRPDGPVEEPWPEILSLLGTCAARHGTGWLIGTSLGLVAWDGTAMRLVGDEPVVALLPGDDATLVVGRDGVAELSALPENLPSFGADLSSVLVSLARGACRGGGVTAHCAALEVLEELVPGDATATAMVLEALESGDPKVRLAAITVVQKRRIVAARARLTQYAGSADPVLRGRAVQALVALGDSRAAALLVESLRELAPEEARRLIRDFTNTTGRPAVDVLRPFVLDERPAVRRSALLWLGKLGFPRPLLGAIAQLERHQTGEREKGARNLASLRDPVVVYLLATHLRDPALPVRRQALMSLAEVAVDLEVPPETHTLVLPALDAALTNDPDDPEVCRAVALLSKRVGHAVPHVLVERAMNSRSPAVRCAAVQMVESQHRRDMVPRIIECLKDPALEVRGAAVDALGRLGDPRGLAPLRELLAESRTYVVKLAGEPGQRAVARAMARILAVDVPLTVEVGGHDVWSAWYRESVEPLMARFGLGRGLKT